MWRLNNVFSWETLQIILKITIFQVPNSVNRKHVGSEIELQFYITLKPDYRIQTSCFNQISICKCSCLISYTYYQLNSEFEWNQSSLSGTLDLYLGKPLFWERLSGLMTHLIKNNSSFSTTVSVNQALKILNDR